MNQKENIPHFLIVGTMKGGTTALYNFITLHPDIERATEKEIHYFSLNYYKGPEWYLNHFSQNSGKVTGEASPTYFDAANTPQIPNLIRSFNPEVKIILIVRDPIERAASHYNHLSKVNKVSEVSSLDVNEFLTLPLSDAMAENTTVGFRLKQVLSFSFYYRKYILYKKVFDRNNILVLSNTGLRENPFETMKQVYEFVGVTPLKFEEFTKMNYSSGTDIKMLNSSTIDYLAELFYPDYRKFCKASGIEYSEMRP